MKKLIIKELKNSGSKGFSLLAGINRGVIPNHVTKMATSLEKMGPVRPIVVAVLSFVTGAPVAYIIDGQHLYHALMRLGWDIPYTEIEINDAVELAEHLAMLNNSSKSWAMVDYINVWAHVNKDYIKLNQYYNTYDIELSQLADLLMNGSCLANIGGNNTISGIIKRGEFKIDDEQKSVFLMNCITDSLKIVPRMDRMSNKLFISSYVNFINSVGNYDHKQFLVNLKLNKDKFKLATQDPEQYNKLLKQIMK
jgi:hypothetical protein